MRHTLWVIMLGVACPGLLCLCVSGCGKTEEAAPVAAAAAAAPQPRPEVVLQQFLTAVKAGQKNDAENLLTTLAREKTASEGIGINNISPTMSFDIQGVQELDMPDGNKAAHVSCVFSEKRDDGKTESHNIIWAMRQEATGWRVAGMAWTPFPGEPPILMNFEDPADMLLKEQLLAEELERRANPQAAQPATTVAGTPGTGTPTPDTPATMQPVQPVQPNFGAVQPNTGVVQAGNSTPANALPGTVNAPQQQVPPPQQVERFTAPSPLR